MSFEGLIPLGYGTFYENISYREALTQTYDTEYPDGLVQLWQIFKSDRTGDLVLSAQPGYDLRARYEYPEHRATHGALHEQQIVVPLAINVPIETEHIRTVDLFPTVLSHFGHTVESKSDRWTACSLIWLRLAIYGVHRRNEFSNPSCHLCSTGA